MAAERFSRLFTLPPKQYVRHCPVLLEAGALLKDEVTGRVLAQLRLSSLSGRQIIAVIVELSCFDVMKNPLNTETFQFLDLDAEAYQSFGEQTALFVRDSHTRSFEATVKTVVFGDGGQWENTADAKLASLPQPVPLPLEGEINEQYQREMGREKGAPLSYALQEHEHLWQCGCGQWNMEEDRLCHACQASRTKQSKMAEERVLLPLLERYQERLETKRRREEADQLVKAAKKRRNKIWVSAAVLASAVLLLVSLVMTQFVMPSQAYKEAERLLAAGEYAAASAAFTRAGVYRDALKRAWDIRYAYLQQGQLAAGRDHTVGLRVDGTVVAVGKDDAGQTQVGSWRDVIAVASKSWHTVGLKADGSVVAVGNNTSGETGVSGWTDIVAVAAGFWHTVGLKADGTVVAVGDHDDGQTDVSAWTRIVAVAAGGKHTIGLHTDGTVVAVGNNANGQTAVGRWRNMAAVAAGMSHTVGLKADATVVAAGSNAQGQAEVSGWTEIAAVAAGDYHTVGLKRDGTAVAVGSNSDGQTEVSGWTDIVAVAAGGRHTVGLRADGTVVAVGRNQEGQTGVNGWTEIGGRLFTPGIQ
ncbi:MAG: hypothetical protein VB099_03575 [Candidatus Limiplasma sp.]|nr:hypothetical protein [Candidatus Limiplasma sp.]